MSTLALVLDSFIVMLSINLSDDLALSLRTMYRSLVKRIVES